MYPYDSPITVCWDKRFLNLGYTFFDIGFPMEVSKFCVWFGVYHGCFSIDPIAILPISLFGTFADSPPWMNLGSPMIWKYRGLFKKKMYSMVWRYTRYAQNLNFNWKKNSMATVRFGSVSRFGSTLGRFGFTEPRNRTQSMFGSIIPERIRGFPGHSFLMAFFLKAKSFKKHITRHTD